VVILACISGSPRASLPAAARPSAIPLPNIAPIIPPRSPNSPDSTRNNVNIVLFLAPIAFIIPISLVLSRTDVNIVFAMPIPLTSIDIPAMIYTNIWTAPNTPFICSNVACELCTLKS